MTIVACRSCDSYELIPILNLGMHKLSDFRADSSEPPAYPLNLVMCARCTLLQLDSTTPRAELYHERYGYKSGVSELIKSDLNSVVHTGLKAFITSTGRNPTTWLDIASNDGTLLSYVPASIYRAGVDPLGQFAAEAEQHANAICVEYFDPTTFGSQVFDVITSVSMFYDLDDPNAFVAGVKQVLAPDGVWVIQQNYALDMLNGGVFDNICHEHVTYFALSSLEPLLHRHGLEVNRVYHSPMNGGCIRTVVSRIGAAPIHHSVFSYRQHERALNVSTEDGWAPFQKAVTDRVNRLTEFVTGHVDKGENFAIYGASTRGATIWQAAGLGPAHFRYAVERQEAKIGKWMSAVGVPIVSEDQLRRDVIAAGQPSFAVVGPWFLGSAINYRESEAGGYLRGGGRLVYPLPELDVWEFGPHGPQRVGEDS